MKADAKKHIEGACNIIMSVRRLKMLISLMVCITLLASLTPMGFVSQANAAESPPFAKGADVSWLPQMEASGFKFYNDAGEEQDALEILKDHGIDSIRLRTFVNPSSDPISGHVSQAETIDMAVRVHEMGFRVMIDFHYSDTWADPGHQDPPLAWQNATFEELKTLMYDYTYDFMDELKDRGVTPEWVQIGNETNPGMMLPYGSTSNFNQLSQLFTTGHNAVKAVSPETKTIIHGAFPVDNKTARWYYDNLIENDTPFDIIGLSYYPHFVGNDFVYSIDVLADNMNDLAERTGKEVMIVETGGDVFYADTVYNQLVAVQNKVKAIPNNKGTGVFYWEPQGADIWSGYGLSAWNNDGTPSSALDAFIEGATEIKPNPVTSVSLEGDTDIIEIGNSVTPTTTLHPANATYRGVTYTSSDPEIASVGLYNGTISGLSVGNATITVTTYDGGHTDSFDVTVVPSSKLLPNGGFEFGLESWTFTGDEDAFNLSTGDKHSGLNALGFFNETAYNATASQVLTDLPNGTYSLSAWSQGQGNETTNQIYAQSGDNDKLTADFTNTGWSVWTQAIINDIQVTDGTLEIGANIVGNGGNWGTYDDFELVYTSTTLSDLTVDGTTIMGFDPQVTDYTVELPLGTTSVPQITASATESEHALLTVTQASSVPGDATVEVAVNGITRTYTVHFTTPFIKNAGFEIGNADSWTIPDETAYQFDGPARTGNKSLGFNLDAPFTFEAYQTITGLSNGTYRLSAYSQGGYTVASNQLYAVNGNNDRLTADIDNVGWLRWIEVVIEDIQVTDGTLTVGVDVEGHAGNWGSFDDFELVKTSADESAKMDWWTEDRFGMFIHFGSYSELGRGEWAFSQENWDKADYQEQVSASFNPTLFDAEEIATYAENAGMKYLVITAKHHEGFSMWDTEVAGFTDTTGSKIYSLQGYTPFGETGRDLLMELKNAVESKGIKFALYYSIMDWGHPTQTINNTGTVFTDMASEEARTQYINDMKAQLKELIDKYDPAILWFDGDWNANVIPPTLSDWWSAEDAQDLYDYLTELNPDLIINDRIKRDQGIGDFTTPEQEVPLAPLNRPWETNATLNYAWGYNEAQESRYKPIDEVIQEMVNVVARGGNYLLNIGPKGDGTVTDNTKTVLNDLAAWMADYSDSIHGTTGSPYATALDFNEPSWGRFTKKDGKLFAHVFSWPTDGTLQIPAIENTIHKIYLMNEPETNLTYTVNEGQINIAIPATAPNANASVIVIETDGVPKYDAPVLKNYILNPGFETGTADNWTITDQSSYAPSGVRTGNASLGFWNLNPFEFEAYQTITDLPNGTYRLSAYSQGGGNENVNRLYAVDSNDLRSTADFETTGWLKWNKATIENIQVTDGTLTVGVQVDGNAGDWGSFDDFELVQISNPAPISGLDTPMRPGETANATTSEPGAGNWTSSNPSVASIDSTTGKVTALAAGTTTISYTTSDSGNSNSITITVLPAPSTPIINVDSETTNGFKAYTLAQLRDALQTGDGGVASNEAGVEIPAAIADLVGDGKLTVKGASAELVIPAAVLEQLAGLVPTSELATAKIVIAMEKLPISQFQSLLTTAGRDRGAVLEAAGAVYELSLSIGTASGTVQRVTDLAEPVTVKLQTTEDSMDVFTAIYYISDEGKVEYAGGKLEDGYITAEVRHFSKYGVLSYDKTFRDVPAGHWVNDAVKALSAKGIIEGVKLDEFRPGDEVTRAQFTEMLVRALGLQASEESAFTDVSADSWYAEAVAAAVKHGIVHGRSQILFAPNAAITREEMVVMLIRAYEFQEGQRTPSGSVDKSELESIPDGEQISEWAKSAVQAAYSLGLVKGDERGSFKPQDYATRAHSAQLIYRLTT